MECKQCDQPNQVVVINIYFLLPIIIKQTLKCIEFLRESGWYLLKSSRQYSK